jgi:hypothetical protein
MIRKTPPERIVRRGDFLIGQLSYVFGENGEGIRENLEATKITKKDKKRKKSLSYLFLSAFIGGGFCCGARGSNRLKPRVLGSRR